MKLETRLLRGPAELDSIAERWDRLPLGRGAHADLYDTHTWLSAWLDCQPAEVGERLRVVIASDGDRLCGLLPLLETGNGTWEAAAKSFRPRFRPVVAGDAPLESIVSGLSEELARQGVRELSLPGLPSRDPASAALADALSRSGFSVAWHAGPDECLAPVTGGWDEHRRAFKKYDRTVKNFSNKATRLGPITYEHFADGHSALSDGYPLYVDLHGRGWKGALREPMLSHRRALLERGGRAGLAHLFVMRVAGVPAAAIIWFLVGPVAIAYSTVYDQRFSALSAGTIVMWQAHDLLLSPGGIEWIDYLPGHGPQKDQLGTERPPLQRLEASRRSAVGGWVAPLKTAVRRAAAAAIRRARSVREESGATNEAPVACRVMTVEPGARHALGDAIGLDALDPRTELYLAVAGGHQSPAAMARGWLPGDRWWRVGVDDPHAFVRIGGGEVREVVRVDPVDVDQILAAVARSSGETLGLLLPDPRGPRRAIATRVVDAPLPWPAGAPAD